MRDVRGGAAEKGASDQDWTSGSWERLGRGLGGGGQRGEEWSSPGCGDTKGPVCPSLAHALHSHPLSSLGGGAWKGRGLLLAWSPVAPLPASPGRCLALWVSAPMTRDDHPTPLNWERAGPRRRGGRGRGLGVTGPLQTLEAAGRTAAGAGWEEGGGAAGAEAAAGCPLAPGVLGEAEPPEPELVEVEVGSTALLQCGPSRSQDNLSNVDWFSVSAKAPEGSSGGLSPPVAQDPTSPASPLRFTRRRPHSSSACAMAWVRVSPGSTSTGSAFRMRGLLWP